MKKYDKNTLRNPKVFASAVGLGAFDTVLFLESFKISLFNSSITGVTEARITKQVSLLNNLNPNGYSYEFTPAETTPCGTLLYIANHVSYKCCNDLNIYQKNGLESTFTEIVKPKK